LHDRNADTKVFFNYIIHVIYKPSSYITLFLKKQYQNPLSGFKEAYIAGRDGEKRLCLYYDDCDTFAIIIIISFLMSPLLEHDAFLMDYT
jgi:hypothetical protein